MLNLFVGGCVAKALRCRGTHRRRYMRVPTMGVLGLALLAALVAVGACGVRDCAVRESGRVHAPESPVGAVWRAEEGKAPEMEWSVPQWKAEEAMGPWIRGRATWTLSFSTEATSPGVCRRALRTCARARRRREVIVLNETHRGPANEKKRPTKETYTRPEKGAQTRRARTLSSAYVILL